MTFNNVSVNALANVYFDGNVVSHAIVEADGTSKTLGVIFPGEYYFGTEAAERMDISDGACSVKIDGEETSNNFAAGTHFDVAANSGFTITVEGSPCQYICSYLA